MADPEWHREQEEAEYPRDFRFEQAVQEMLILYRRSKMGFDLNSAGLS